MTIVLRGGVCMNFEAHKISANQVDDFCAILKEAAMWLQSEGQGLWDIEHVAKEHILNQYLVEEMFLGFLEGIPVATMVLQEADDFFWPSVTKNESLFLHKLSVRRQFAKSGLAGAMIMWAKSEAKSEIKDTSGWTAPQIGPSCVSSMSLKDLQR